LFHYPMFQKLKHILLAFIAVLAISPAFAQVYSASAKIDSSKIHIGGQTNLQLKVFVPADVMAQKEKFVQWPVFTDTIASKIEIVEAGKIDTSLSADKKTYHLTQNFIITSFDSGFWVIPPFRFLRDGDSAKFFETQAMLLEVATVPVDTTEAIRDIKEPIEVPYTLAEALPYIIGFAAILALGIFLIRYFRRKKHQPAIVLEKEPALPPHVIAIQKLEQIKDQKLWQAGQVKDYHSAITEVVRIYLEDRFKINALEQTSDEIILSCRSLPIEAEPKMKLQQMLKLADLVKFAKVLPLPNENELSIAHAIEFVSATIPLELPKEIKEEEEEVKHV
jgi:hypothetical protein